MKQLTFFLCLMLLFSCKSNEQPEIVSQVVIEKIIDELNKDEIPRGEKIIAIVGATLIDGNGGNPLANSLVIIENKLCRCCREYRDSRRGRNCRC
jgi:hypothetical protein